MLIWLVCSWLVFDTLQTKSNQTQTIAFNVFTVTSFDQILPDTNTAFKVFTVSLWVLSHSCLCFILKPTFAHHVSFMLNKPPFLGFLTPRFIIHLQLSLSWIWSTFFWNITIHQILDHLFKVVQFHLDIGFAFWASTYACLSLGNSICTTPIAQYTPRFF